MLHIPDLSSVVELASQYPLVLEITKYTWLNAQVIPAEVQAVQENLDRTIPSLVAVFKGTDAVTFISFFGDLLPKLESEVSSFEKV